MINETRIVKIIDEYTIVINKGSDDGIKPAHKFLIYSIDQEPLVDPITNENLGSLEIVKGQAKVKHIQNKITTLESDSYTIAPKKIIKRSNKNPFYDPFSTTSTEEILGEKEVLPFDNVSIGDYAKMI